MKSRVFALLLAVLLLSLPLGAMAANRYPALSGVVTDAAGVLDAATMEDILQYQALLDEEDVDIELRVVLVHFLDGESAQSYAQAVFSREGLGRKTLLLLGAVGEDRFECVLGEKVKKKLNESGIKAMLYSSGFAEQFQAQEYAAAFGSFFGALTEQVEKQYGAELETKGLFGNVTAPAQPVQQTTSYAQQLKDFFSNYVRDAKERGDASQHGKPTEGLTPAGWVVLVVLIMLIFSQSDPARKARNKRRRR